VSIPPNSDLVALAWLKGAAGVTADRVATTLPTGSAADAALALGFVQATIVGGTPDIDIPVRRPVVAVDVWWSSDGKPQWGKAFALAETIRLATEGTATWRRAVAMPAGYDPARVMTVMVISEPRRILSDPGRRARVQLDIEIHWRPGA
jgi:hypothetical protein